MQRRTSIMVVFAIIPFVHIPRVSQLENLLCDARINLRSDPPDNRFVSPPRQSKWSMDPDAADSKLIAAAKKFARGQSSTGTSRVVPSIDNASKQRYESFCKSGCDALQVNVTKRIDTARDRAKKTEQHAARCRQKKDAAVAAYEAIRARCWTTWHEHWPTDDSKEANKARRQLSAAKDAIASAEEVVRSSLLAAANAQNAYEASLKEIDGAKAECAINSFLATKIATDAGETLPTPSVDPTEALAAWNAIPNPEKLWRSTEYAKGLISESSTPKSKSRTR